MENNTFLTPEVVAKEALMVLQSNLCMADLVHRDHSSEFVAVGDTVSIRKPAKFVAKNFTGTTENQDIKETSVPVKMDRFRDVTVAVTSKEMTLDIADFSKQVVEPAMQAIAQAIDEDLLAVAYENAGYTKEVEGKLADIADIAKQLDMEKAPVADRSLVLHPKHKYTYALNEELSNVSYAGDNQTLRDALLGRVFTLDTYMDQNAPDSLAKEPGTAKTFTVSGKAGEMTVTVSGSDGSVSAGDGFVLDGYLYRFTESGEGALAIDQKLMCDCQNAEVALVNTPNSLAFHRNAIALVSRNLALPMGASRAAYAEANGLGVRVVYDYDAATKTDKISFDIIYGIKALEPKLICALKG